MDVAGRFAENLARCRERANLSQEELGARASLSRRQIDTLERGECLPHIDVLLKLAGGLSISPEELLHGIGWRPGTLEAGEFELEAGETEGDPEAGPGAPVDLD